MNPRSSGANANSTRAPYRRAAREGQPSTPGQEHVERRAAAVAVLEPRAAAVELGEPPDERQAYAHPRRVRRRGARRLAERFEHGLVQIGWDASTLVLDRQGRIAARILGSTTQGTLTALVDDVLAEKA